MFESLTFGMVEPFVVGFGTYLMRRSAQKMEIEAKLFQMSLQKGNFEDDSSDKASKRTGSGGILVRRFIVFMTFTVVFGGIAYVGITQGVMTHLIPTPIKEHLFGLLTTGGKLKEIVTTGFVMTPEMWRILKDIMGYYFGKSLADVRR